MEAVEVVQTPIPVTICQSSSTPTATFRCHNIVTIDRGDPLEVPVSRGNRKHVLNARIARASDLPAVRDHTTSAGRNPHASADSAVST